MISRGARDIGLYFRVGVVSRRRRRGNSLPRRPCKGGIFTIKYDKSLRICETLIGHDFESEGNEKFYLFAL